MQNGGKFDFLGGNMSLYCPTKGSCVCGMKGSWDWTPAPSHMCTAGSQQPIEAFTLGHRGFVLCFPCAGWSGGYPQFTSHIQFYTAPVTSLRTHRHRAALAVQGNLFWGLLNRTFILCVCEGQHPKNWADSSHTAASCTCDSGHTNN